MLLRCTSVARLKFSVYDRVLHLDKLKKKITLAHSLSSDRIEGMQYHLSRGL